MFESRGSSFGDLSFLSASQEMEKGKASAIMISYTSKKMRLEENEKTSKKGFVCVQGGTMWGVSMLSSRFRPSLGGKLNEQEKTGRRYYQKKGMYIFPLFLHQKRERRETC